MKTLTDLDSLWDDLSNVEFSCVLDGGSARVLALPPGGCDWLPAYVDVDGLWADGYVSDLRGWKIDRHYS